MDKLLRLLSENSNYTTAQLSMMLGEPEEAIEARIKEYENNGVIRGYQAVVNWDDVPDAGVMAIIELKVAPQMQKGFDDIKNDEDAALEIVMNEMNTEDNPLDEDQQRQSYEVLMPRMETEDGNFLTMQDDVWQSYIDWMYDQGLIEEKCEPSDVMTAPQF